MPKTIAINTGSSSLKWQLYQMPNGKVVAKGIIERIDLKGSISTAKYGKGQKYEVIVSIDDHEVAAKMLLGQLINLNTLGSYDEITGVGHRVVAGGEEFKGSVVVTDEVLEKIEVLSKLAPLYDLANAVGIKAFKRVSPEITSVAVLDTSSHATMPEHSCLYSVSREYYEEFTTRKYGAHRISHRYVFQRAIEMLGRPIEDLKIITYHSGNSASITAADGDGSIDTSMGFIPFAGTMIGTRSGDVNVSLSPCLMIRLGLADVQDMVDILNKRSGLLSLTGGLSSDIRDTRSNLDKPEAQTAYNVFIGRIRKYIGSHVTAMNGADTVIFTAGTGENAVGVRKDIIDSMIQFGCEIDDDRNNIRGEEAVISTDDSKVKLLLVPTDEELIVAHDIEHLR